MSENQVIPEAAVEAAAWAIYEMKFPLHAATSFDQVGGPIQDECRASARHILTTAAPHMVPLGPHPTWGSEVNPANNAHIAYCPQCRANFGGAPRG